ncbi:MAG: NUDIX pyrophosphatase [Bacilli bacterium]
MRKPIQILVIPYRKNVKLNCIEYCLFLREDLNVWQGIAGGVEDNETVEQSARREMFEESNIPYNSNLIKLSSFISMPSINISGTKWGKGIYIVKEYSFGVCADNIKIKISDEHKSFKWVDYSVAMKLLKWDSNKNALWELNERLCKNDY